MDEGEIIRDWEKETEKKDQKCRRMKDKKEEDIERYIGKTGRKIFFFLFCLLLGEMGKLPR